MMYRDLKPENILIDKTGHIKLTDFGLSKILSKDKEKAYTICGTPQYLAPEILTCNGYDDSVDWWSLGCIMYKMLLGVDAFRFSRDESLSPEKYETEIIVPDYVSKNAKDLIRKLLVVNPKKRLGSGPGGAEKIKDHPYFSDIDWEKAWNKELEPPFVPNLDDDEDELDLKYFDQGFTSENIETNNEIYSYEEPSSQNAMFKGFTFVNESYRKNFNDGRKSDASDHS